MRTLAEARLKPDVAGDVQMKQQLETEGLVEEGTPQLQVGLRQ